MTESTAVRDTQSLTAALIDKVFAVLLSANHPLTT